MDAFEAMVMWRIQSLDPVNASKIMGYIQIQDPGEKEMEMIRLAFCPDDLLLSYINEAKARLAMASSAPLPYPVRPDSHFRANSPGFLIGGPHSPFQRSRARPVPVFDRSNSGSGPGMQFYGGNDFAGGDLPFLDESIISPSGRFDSLVFPSSYGRGR